MSLKKKKKSPLAVLLFIAAILVAVLAIGLINNARSIQSKVDETTETNLASHEDNSTTEKENDIPTLDIQTEPKAGDSMPSPHFDLEKAATPRILGNPDAPVKISEHSSFTCGACSAFHKDNFKQIKKDYIDTGKAYLVFDDFPRNAFDIKNRCHSALCTG